MCMYDEDGNYDPDGTCDGCDPDCCEYYDDTYDEDVDLEDYHE